MGEEILAALGPYLDRVRAKAEADADFRALLRAVGRTLEALAAEPAAAPAQDLPDCYLWMGRRDRPPADPARLTALAGCYEAAADAADLLRVAGDAEVELFPPVLDLAAEAQSALRTAVGAANGRTDNDQVRLYIVIKEAAAREGHFIQRFMRTEGPADPAAWSELRERIRQF